MRHPHARPGPARSSHRSGHRSGHRAGLAAIVAALALAVTATLSVPGAGPARAADRTAPARAADPYVQTLDLVYRGAADRPVTLRTATVPGIGQIEAVCRRTSTQVRLVTDERRYETQMWTQRFEERGTTSVQVKNARIYRWAHAEDDGTGGTGYQAHEGLNQSSPPETFSKGYLNGIVSQRSGRRPDVPGAQLATPRPVTVFELTWYWENLREPERFRYCRIQARFTTVLAADQRIDLTWHGDAQAPGREVRTTTVPGVGTLTLTCAADPTQTPTLTLAPQTPGGASLYVERVTGAGDPRYQVVTSEQDLPAEGATAFDPVPLPSNGTLRFRVLTGGRSTWFMLSSYYVLNDRFGPNRNLCEVAAGAYQARFS